MCRNIYLQDADSWRCRLVLGMWNITSLPRKELELVQEVEWWLTGPTLMYHSGSGIKLLERSWTRVVPGERSQAGLGVLTSPWLNISVLESSPANERVASMRLHVAGEKVLSVVVAYAPNRSTDYLALLGSLGSVLEELPSGDPKVLLGDVNAHEGNDGETWSVI